RQLPKETGPKELWFANAFPTAPSGRKQSAPEKEMGTAPGQAPSPVVYQKVILPYNWTKRPPIVTPVICADWPGPIALLPGLPKLGWFSTLNASPRTSHFTPRSGHRSNVLPKDAFITAIPGPVIMLRRKFP